MGQKSTIKLVSAIAASKNRELWRLVNGLSFPQVGEQAARSLAERFTDLNALIGASLESSLTSASPRPSMSIALRAAKCLRVCLRRAGQAMFSQRHPTDSGLRRSGPPQAGHLPSMCWYKSNGLVLRGPFVLCHTHDFRDDCSRPLQDHSVPDSDVSPFNFLLIVQRGARDS